jgi:hypothetical protein
MLRAQRFYSTARKLILGLDVSSRMTGVAVIDYEGHYLQSFPINTREEVTIFDRALKVREELIEMRKSVRRLAFRKFLFVFFFSRFWLNRRFSTRTKDQSSGSLELKII